MSRHNNIPTIKRPGIPEKVDLANFLIRHHYYSLDTPDEFPWEFPEFEQYKNPDFVFDYNGTPVIYAFWTAGYKEGFRFDFRTHSFVIGKSKENPKQGTIIQHGIYRGV